MLRANNYTTILLVLIVIILFVGVGVALYYVLDLDWFEKKPVDIYNEVGVYQEQSNTEIKIEKEIKYDTSKRAYNLALDTEELRVVVYKDGTVGITMVKNDENNQVSIYKEILNKEIKIEPSNIIRAYEVVVSKNNMPNSYIVLLDVEGNLYKLQQKALVSNGKYAFTKIEGLAKIIDVRQITNDNLTENTNGINAIAIDEESNELLLTNYIIGD